MDPRAGMDILQTIKIHCSYRDSNPDRYVRFTMLTVTILCDTLCETANTTPALSDVTLNKTLHKQCPHD